MVRSSCIELATHLWKSVDVFNLLCYTALVVVFKVGWEYYHYTQTILELLADRRRSAPSDT